MAMRVRFLAKNALNFLISLTKPLTSILADIFDKTKRVINHSFQRAWFRQWLWFTLHNLRRDLAYCVIFMNAVKIGCMSVGVVFGPYRLTFHFYGPGTQWLNTGLDLTSGIYVKTVTCPYSGVQYMYVQYLAYKVPHNVQVHVKPTCPRLWQEMFLKACLLQTGLMWIESRSIVSALDLHSAKVNWK